MATPAAADRQLTVEQVAARLGCHRETIRRAIRSGELKATRNRLASGCPFMLAESEVRAFVARRTA